MNRPADKSSAGLFLLLDFLLGDSIAKLAECYELPLHLVEDILRCILLKHGYSANRRELKK